MKDLDQPFGEGLPVELIATPRSELLTCRAHDSLEAVYAGNVDDFDHIPVVDQWGSITGTLDTTRQAMPGASVSEASAPLNSQVIVGEGSGIVAFIEGIRQQPYCSTVGRVDKRLQP